MFFKVVVFGEGSGFREEGLCFFLVLLRGRKGGEGGEGGGVRVISGGFKSFSLVFKVFREVLGFVERDNSSVESILSFSAVCRFTTNFRYWMREKGRKEVQEIERESQVEEKHSHEDDHVDGVKGLKRLEPQCVCG